MVTPPIDLATAVDSDIGGMVEGDKVFVVFWHFWLSRPVSHIFRSNQLPYDLNCYIVSIVEANGHGVVLLGRNSDYSLS